MSLPQRVILASASPRRRELLGLIGLPFKSISADIDESARPGEPPPDHACRLSREKAETAAQQVRQPVLIVAADTIVVNGDEILGKPRDAAEAAAMLRRLRGHLHRVYTAVTLLDSATGQAITDLAASPVRMRSYGDAEIADYISGGDPFDKAGAYAIQHAGFHPVEGFDHCMANVMGLPLCHVTRSLRRLGVEPGADVPTACQAHIGYVCPVYQRILAGEE